MTPLAPANFHGQRLVIFGAGHVGGALARQAAAAGLRVTALTRNPARAAALAADGITPVVADLAASGWHDRIPADAELVLNCVASGGGGLPGYRHGYVDGFRSILAWAARAAAPGHLIYTGSTSVYPQGGGARIDETAPTIPPADDEPAGLLAAAETLAQRWPGRRTVLRLAGIYGPGRHHLLDQLRATPPPATLPGAGEHHLNLIHRDDICGGCWSAWSAGAAAGGIFNLADDGAATRAELVAWLCARLGVPAPAFTGEAAAGRRRVTPDRVIDNTKARRELGWTPRYPTCREGYAAILDATP